MKNEISDELFEKVVDASSETLEQATARVTPLRDILVQRIPSLLALNSLAEAAPLRAPIKVAPITNSLPHLNLLALDVLNLEILLLKSYADKSMRITSSKAFLVACHSFLVAWPANVLSKDVKTAFGTIKTNPMDTELKTASVMCEKFRNQWSEFIAEIRNNAFAHYDGNATKIWIMGNRVSQIDPLRIAGEFNPILQQFLEFSLRVPEKISAALQAEINRIQDR
jgi:hypothetical protein